MKNPKIGRNIDKF